MRTTKDGRRVSLKDELLDVVADNLPECPENEDFASPRSKEWITLGESLVEAIKEHLEEAAQ